MSAYLALRHRCGPYAARRWALKRLWAWLMEEV